MLGMKQSPSRLHQTAPFRRGMLPKRLEELGFNLLFLSLPFVFAI